MNKLVALWLTGGLCIYGIYVIAGLAADHLHLLQ